MKKGLSEVAIQMAGDLFKSAETAKKPVEVKTEMANITFEPGAFKLNEQEDVKLVTNATWSR